MSPEEEEDAVLAAEHVLGLLTPGEDRALRDRLASETRLRDYVIRWSGDLAMLVDGPDVLPPPRIEAALRRQLFAEEAPRPLWRRLGIVPALLGGLVAALLVLWVSTQDLWRQAPASPPFVAEIAAPDRSLVAQASYDPEAVILTVHHELGAVPPDRARQLWLIAGDQAPIPLALLSPDGVEIDIAPDLVPLLSGATLAISDEPPGGSPTGAPTGAVLATGTLTEP